MTADYVLKVAEGCCAITRAMQEGQICKHIRKGFADCGQYPLSFRKIMKQCFTYIPDKDLKEVEELSEEHVKIFQQHGHITDEVLANAHPIFRTDYEDTMPRDQRPIQNQRAIIINHREVVERFIEYRNGGEHIGDALINQADPNKRRKLQNAIKVVQRRRSQEEAKKRKALEAARLSDEEKRVAKEEREKKAREKKRKTEETYQQSLAMVQSHYIKA
jgi:hypothetical protein